MEKITVQRLKQEAPSYRETNSYPIDTNTLTTLKKSRLYFASKRLIDIVVAVIGIAFLSPVFLVIALFIKLDDGGSILYLREMVGLRGKRYVMLKFRTMVPNADIYLQKQAELMQGFQHSMKLKYDPRVTRAGRFLRKAYLDELPQLFNVLIGNMSLVGPRAIHERELPLYGEYAGQRHLVKPGLTGLWQISPDRHRRYEDRIPLDMKYVYTCSLTVDLLILLKTLKVVFARTGV